MKTLLLVVTILAMLCTAFTTLSAVVFCLAGGANATPEQIRALKLWMLGLTLLGVVGIGAGIFLLRAGQPGWAAGISFMPTVIMGVILIVALIK
jgi:hypothetical protein